MFLEGSFKGSFSISVRRLPPPKSRKAAGAAGETHKRHRALGVTATDLQEDLIQVLLGGPWDLATLGLGVLGV